jgi:hypothetical protein
MGWGQSLSDDFQHRLSVEQHIVVPEPQDMPATITKKIVSSGIVLRAAQVLGAVDFHH